MTIWGTIVGGAAGFAIGGPIGALIGAATGGAMDAIAMVATSGPSSADRQSADGSDRDATKSIAFTIAVIALGAKMAKADGMVTADEVAAFDQAFRVPADERRNVERVFNMAKRDARGFEPYARQVAGMFQDRPAVLEELMHCLFHIAKADGKIHENEIAYLRNVANLLGFGDADFQRMRATELGCPRSDPYSILGVPAGADLPAIKAAYRKLVRETHPDRLIAQGVPEEFVVLATEKLATINQAYEQISREREEV